MNDVDKLNIVILPNGISNEISVSLSRQLNEKFNTHFKLDGVSLHPHISLYHLITPEKNYNKIVEMIKSVAKSTKMFKVSLSRLTFEVTRNFIHWKCDITKELRDLHEKLIMEINPLREGVESSYYSPKNYTKEQQENLVKYGYPASMELFDPHITITKLADTEKSSVLKQLPAKIKQEFTAKSIHLGRLGEYGTVTEILEEFPLRNNL